jgi:hypothetical protein
VLCFDIFFKIDPTERFADLAKPNFVIEVWFGNKLEPIFDPIRASAKK